MALLLQSWMVLTGGLLTVLAVVVGVQGLLRLARRPAVESRVTVARPALRLVQS